MPLLEEIFDALNQTKVFNTLDLKSSYHQLPLKEGHKVKATFWGINPCGKNCLYQQQFLPFGFKNALANFQKVMDRVLVGLGFAKCYIDDIIVLSSTSKDHKHHLHEVFKRLKDHNFKLHPKKCQFFQTQVEYLGHMIYPNGLGVQKAKVEPISQIPQPTDVNQLRTFLRLCNYYQIFVKRFNNIVKPLTRLTQINQEYVQGEEQEQAFQELKTRLFSTPILK